MNAISSPQPLPNKSFLLLPTLLLHYQFTLIYFAFTAPTSSILHTSTTTLLYQSGFNDYVIYFEANCVTLTKYFDYESQVKGNGDTENGQQEVDKVETIKVITKLRKPSVEEGLVIQFNRKNFTFLVKEKVLIQYTNMKPHYHIDETKAETDSLKGSCFNKSFRKYCFWFIIAFLAALTIKDVYDLCVEYSENPKKADMNIMFNETMQLPNITFCLSRDQAWSHFKISKNDTNEIWDQVIKDDLANMTDKKSFLEKQWEDKSIMEAYEIIATLSSMERETTAHGSMRSINVFRIQPRLKKKREIIKKWLDAIHERKVTFEEFTQKVGTEVIRRSLQRFQRTSYDENLVIKTKLKTSWISMMQFCFQPWYDEENYKLIADQGNFFTMMLSHNADNLEGKDLECMSVDFHGRPSSLSRFMEGKGRVKDGFIDELCHGQRHEVTVEIRARYKMLENDDEGTACRDVEAGEDNEFNCRSRCRMEMIKKACNCTAATLSYLVKEEDLATFPVCDYSKCEVDVQRGNFSDAECSKNCYRECDQIRYEVDHASKGKMVRGDLTLVNLNWGSFEFLTLEQDWVWTLATFIAGLGGSIGIWLGLSILSLIEGSTFLYKYFHAKILKKRSRVAAEERQSQIKRNEAREVAGGKNGTSIEIGNLGKS